MKKERKKDRFVLMVVEIQTRLLNLRLLIRSSLVRGTCDRLM